MSLAAIEFRSMNLVYIGIKIKKGVFSHIIGGLDPKVTEADLYSAFVPFGEIVATHLPKNNSSKKINLKLRVVIIIFSGKASRFWIRRV